MIRSGKLTAEFKKLPYVTATGLSSMDILSGYGGFLFWIMRKLAVHGPTGKL